MQCLTLSAPDERDFSIALTLDDPAEEETPCLPPPRQRTRKCSKLVGALGLALACFAAVLAAKPWLPRLNVDDAVQLVLVTRKKAARTEAPAPPAPTQCSKRWDQCGGEGYDGPTCCEEGQACLKKPLDVLPSYRQCVPDGDESCAEAWGQCGGEGFDGPTCCKAGHACLKRPLGNFPSYRQCVPDGDESCAELWAQCGGEGFDGPTCCQRDNVCTKKPLKDLPSFRQCRPPPPPPCEDPAPGSVCYNRVMWDMNRGIWMNPDWYHGLTPQSGFKEFQEYEHFLNFNKSQCNRPCAPGTCYFVFRFEGCDSINEWTCEKPNDSVSYKCCCEYFHSHMNKTKPLSPSPQLLNAMQAIDNKHPTLFCTAMMMPFGYEVDLMRAQYENGKLGLFSCDEFAVYSNETVRISPEGEMPLIETALLHGSLTGVVGGEFHTVLNTRVFLKFWRKVFENKHAYGYDWVVKLDPDTLFIPVRLKALLLTKDGPLGEEEPHKGLWLNNCRLGLHGPIEVFSLRAFKTFHRGHEKCEEGKAAKHGQEDWFLRECFTELGIRRVDAYNLLFEATYACEERPSSWQPYRPPCFAPEVAFHPFKSVESYMHCFNETKNHPYALPTEAIDDGPNASNERHA